MGSGDGLAPKVTGLDQIQWWLRPKSMEIGFQTHLLAEAKIGVKAKKIGVKIPTIIIIIIFIFLQWWSANLNNIFFKVN